MTVYRHITVIVVLLLILVALTPRESEAETLSRDQLIQDTRYLAGTIESAHPDPYLRGGGKIAFHRRLRQILEAIPDSGMSADEYFGLVRPLVASVGDGHTSLLDPRQFDPYSPGGIPLYFATSIDGLYVVAVLSEADRELIGARLVAVEGIAFEGLVERCRGLRGADNEYLLYQSLGGQGVLWYGGKLQGLLPEWTDTDSVTVTLRLADDRLIDRSLRIPETVDYASLVMAPTRDRQMLVDLMTEMQHHDIFYRFLDSSGSQCLLVIHDLSTYRETFEVWHSYGITGRESEGRRQYLRYHGTQPPTEYSEVLAGLPSATETLRSMVIEMKEKGCRDLIIDLTQNDGGSSVLSHILIYFLYGKESNLVIRGNTTEIVKLSPEYFDLFPSPSLEEINSHQSVPLEITDYDFDADRGHWGGADRTRLEGDVEAMISRMPTFAREYHTGEYNDYYRPENVLVLCDAGTFSAAFTVMYYLKEAGAGTAGVPSAQAGNCFGDLMSFSLPNTGIGFTISRKYFELLPNEPLAGRVLMPDFPLTFDAMTRYGFDPNMWLWFAQDLLADAGRPN